MLQGEETAIGDMTLVALGSNAPSSAGDAAATLTAALARMQVLFGPLKISPFYKTPAIPAGAGPDFVNAACGFQTDLTPTDCLAALHGIEADFGRTRDIRWGQRTLDLDLIAHGAMIAPDRPTWDHWQQLAPDQQALTAPDQLILPHPRLAERAFVLVPLADVAPDWTHPVIGRTVRQMRDARPQDELATVKALNG